MTGQAVNKFGPDSTIHIVGAGPAGLACAIVLAQAGRRVVVADRRRQPGGRFHGDFQGLENWSSHLGIIQELKSSGIQPTFDHTAVRAGTAFDAWGKAYAIKSEDPLYYLLRRGDVPGSLDRALLAQARKLGVDVRFGEKVIEMDGPAVLAAGPRRADAIAVGYTFETGMADGNWICFNDRLAPLGYSYLLVSGGRGTVASCMFSGFKNQRHHVEQTVSFFRERAGLRMTSPRPFGGYGNFRIPRTGIQGEKLVVGEHAGFQDPLAGFGMGYAMRSGIIAARSILEGLNYTQLWRKEILPGMRTSISNRYLFNIAGDRGRRWGLARYIAKGDTRHALFRLYRPWWLSRLVYPLAFWLYRAPLKDRSCDHVDCRCVWCEHGLKPKP